MIFYALLLQTALPMSLLNALVYANVITLVPMMTLCNPMHVISCWQTQCGC